LKWEEPEVWIGIVQGLSTARMEGVQVIICIMGVDEGD